MDEADRVAHRIAIIDHGSIVAQGTSAELKQQTDSESLEAGVSRADRIIDPRRRAPSSADQMRQCREDVERQADERRFTFSGCGN